MLLIEYQKQELWRGTIFRFPAKYPFESMVEFMLMDYPNAESGFALYCVSGYHAGSLENILSQESLNSASRSVSTRWIIENWEKQIYIDCMVTDVEVIV